jgi:hypothetical protein
MEESLIQMIANHFASSSEGEVVELIFACGGRRVALYAKIGEALFDASDRKDGSAMVRFVVPAKWAARLVAGEERIRLYLESVLHHELYHVQDKALSALSEEERAEIRARVDYYSLPWEVRAYQAKWDYLVSRKGLEWTRQIPAAVAFATKVGILSKGGSDEGV